MSEFNLSDCDFPKEFRKYHKLRKGEAKPTKDVKEFIRYILKYPTNSVLELKNAVEVFAGDKLK
jgi:hypothetical protein